MLPQSPFMICAVVREDQLENLRAVLAGMNTAPGVVHPFNPLVPFGRFERLHFARFLILETPPTEDMRAYGRAPRPWPPTLIFMGDCDGPFAGFLAQLAERAGDGLIRIFSHCRHFKAETPYELLQWMKACNVRPAANYVNWLGRSKIQVEEEAALHAALKKQLPATAQGQPAAEPETLHQALRKHVQAEVRAGRLQLTRIPATPWSWRLRNWLHLIGVPLVLLLLAPLLLILLPVYLLRLRAQERSDPEVLARPDRHHVARLAEQEDQYVTNQFSAFGDVKPGLFRRYTILFLLFMLNYSTRHIYNKGFLTRVQTIHFARWVLLDDNNRVLFASNYDGSLESYMDDFINKVAWGLNLVFSNGAGYPGTRWLIKGGAEQEQKFKSFLRRHQYYTEVWYKAYPDLTAVDLARNARIRRGIETERFTSPQALRDWLALI